MMAHDPTRTPEERLEQAERRYRRIVRGIIVAVALLVIYAIWATSAIVGLTESSTRDRCDNRLTGDYLVGIARALAAPPAPNPERGAAVTDIERAADRITNSDDVCANGVPRPLVPATVPPSSTTPR